MFWGFRALCSVFCFLPKQLHFTAPQEKEIVGNLLPASVFQATACSICAKAFRGPKAPETIPTSDFPRKPGVAPKFSRNSYWIHTKRNTNPHSILLSSAEFSWLHPNSTKSREISRKFGGRGIHAISHVCDLQFGAFIVRERPHSEVQVTNSLGLQRRMWWRSRWQMLRLTRAGVLYFGHFLGCEPVN